MTKRLAGIAIKMAVDNITEQKLRASILLGAQLLIDNGLGDWKIKINRKRSSLAQTWHEEKTISYSKWFLMVANRGQIEGVTLHEAAHALLGAGQGHNRKFIQLCTELSSSALYACRSTDIRIAKYIAICPECGYGGGCNDERDRYCRYCCEKGKNVKFEIKLNEYKVVPL